jgi:serine/threonine protein kinase
MTNQAPIQWLATTVEAEAEMNALGSRIQRRRTPACSGLIAALRSLVRFVRALFGKADRPGFLGPYRLSGKIGQGGMGIIYKAAHPRSKRAVAIKVLPPERRSQADQERFEREARVTSLLRHPHTVSVHGFGRGADGAPYYVMEYLEGPDLQTLVEREGPLPPARVAVLLAQLAGALQEVHALGLLHGDVKPANVVCSPRPGGGDHAKLLDFGLARPIGAVPGGATGEGRAVVGTPLYLSPEALLNPERVDARSDLYALGAVGYFLLTGVPPFSGRSILHVFSQHVHASPLSPSERLGKQLPRELEAIILSCLSKSPDGRPASAAALFERLSSGAFRAALERHTRIPLRISSETTEKNPVRSTELSEGLTSPIRSRPECRTPPVPAARPTSSKAPIIAFAVAARSMDARRRQQSSSSRGRPGPTPRRASGVPMRTVLRRATCGTRCGSVAGPAVRAADAAPAAHRLWSEVVVPPLGAATRSGRALRAG